MRSSSSSLLAALLLPAAIAGCTCDPTPEPVDAGPDAPAIDEDAGPDAGPPDPPLPAPFTDVETTERYEMPGLSAEAFVVRSWTYDHHEDYGCPPRDERAHTVAAVRQVDARTIELDLDAVPLVRVYEVRLAGLRRAGDGQGPWHGVAWYTRNRAQR